LLIEGSIFLLDVIDPEIVLLPFAQRKANQLVNPVTRPKKNVGFFSRSYKHKRATANSLLVVHINGQK
jgi:hypothetical protein